MKDHCPVCKARWLRANPEMTVEEGYNLVAAHLAYHQLERLAEEREAALIKMEFESGKRSNRLSKEIE